MNLRELVEEIIKVVHEIDNEEVDYKKIANLMSVLKKLIIKFREKAYLSTMPELVDITFLLLASYEENKSTNLGQVLKYMYEISIEVQNDEYIDFKISPKVK